MRGNEAELSSSENIFPKFCLFPHTKKWATACNAEQAPVVVCVRVCLCACVRALLLSLSCAPPFMLDLARMPPARLVEVSSAGFARS